MKIIDNIIYAYIISSLNILQISNTLVNTMRKSLKILPHFAVFRLSPIQPARSIPTCHSERSRRIPFAEAPCPFLVKKRLRFSLQGTLSGSQCSLRYNKNAPPQLSLPTKQTLCMPNKGLKRKNKTHHSVLPLSTSILTAKKSANRQR